MSLRAAMPFLARNEGVWEGRYRYYDAQGDKIDEHKSRLICRIIDDRDYRQTNLYRWADGRKDDREFPAEIAGNRLLLSGPIDGWAAAVDLDDYGRTMMLNWTRKNEPNQYLYEMIQMTDDGLSRARVWQWFRDDRLVQRTLIDELRISTDWRSYDGIDPHYGDIRD